MKSPLLSVKDLHVSFKVHKRLLQAVRGVSFDLYEEEILGIVGESGCGKSATAKALVKLLPSHSSIITGEVIYKGQNLLEYDDREMQKVRGKEIGMIFQDPMTSLNPTMKIGDQIIESYLHHTKNSRRREARAYAIQLLELVGIPQAFTRIDQYPHTLSGGMRQRVMIAISLAAKPKLIIADEPTTALDVTIQAQILDLMQEIKKKTGTSFILITHDMSVVAGYCDRVLVMYSGKIIERASVDNLFANPSHPYTQGLLQSIPRLDMPKDMPLVPIEGSPPSSIDLIPGCAFCSRCKFASEVCAKEDPKLKEIDDGHLLACWNRPPAVENSEFGPTPKLSRLSLRKGVNIKSNINPLSLAQPRGFGAVQISQFLTARGLKMEPLIKIRNLKKYYSQDRKMVKAIDDVSFDIFPGETLGLVGESGCGKSTVARCLLRLTDLSSGSIEFEGNSIVDLKGKELKAFRRQAGMIFQDPYASLNPRMTAGDIIAEPLEIHRLLKGEAKRKRLEELLELVGLPIESLTRYPHEFSGGQKQRIGIARALSMSPRFIICDEPISALDVSVQAQIINLLKKLQKEMGLTYLFIAHDLRIVKYLSTRVVVMYLGQIVEIASSDDLYNTPLHPYTQALLSAIPIPDPVIEKKRQRIILQGEVPSPLNSPKGCPFVTRCPHATPTCHYVRPELKEINPGHFAACHLLKEMDTSPLYPAPSEILISKKFS